MSGLELNKIAASVLLAGLVAMVVGTVSEALYEPGKAPEKRGFTIEGAVTEGEDASAQAPVEEAPLDIHALMAAADATAGEATAKKCVACHDFSKGGADKVGPGLYGVLGGPKAHSSSFAYSTAMKEKGGSWDYESMFQFLHKPSKFLKGTKMTFAGLSKPEDVANVVAYMRKQHDSPPPPP